MIEKLNHFPVNWIDGMKINKTHFLAMQDNVSELVNDAIGIHTTPISYGLLDSGNHSKESTKITLGIDNHKLLRVRVEECHAITPNGSRIEISKANTDTLDLQVPYPEDTYEIKEGESIELLACISVNSKKRIPFGEPDPDEVPPRYPFTQPEYKLHLIKADEFRSGVGYGGFYLAIGKILIGDTTILDENYIPASVTVSCHSKLADMQAEIARSFGQIEIYSVQISQKINRFQQTGVLAQTVMELSDNTSYFLGNCLTQFRWFSLHQHPASMLSTVVSFARVMKNFIDSKAGAGKEELLNYFAEWCDLSQGDLEVLFTTLINTNYDHVHIDKTAKLTMNFLVKIEKLFETLSKLDYIGKKKESIELFVAETEKKDIVHNPKRHGFFIKD
ncbi:hypothetical protein [Flavobacterium foetidum]|uniref:hypothetical protein n=1 Tax=Flavobacterium foetidum TaxID=2026681 RepID=UPI0010753E64|nr:hypothetical protein [Flavobacterium foetidum]KAF2517740.1 hypothetical protein E0W73_00615 [Flavobacterium foetidum]